MTPAPTTGDPILLERLAANLYDNAVRYNVPGGDVWLSTATVEGRAVLTVRNTGHVIAAGAVDGLFQPFRRLRDRTGDGGFGLGLAIVASIATAHGADARPDRGLTVTVTLPTRLPREPDRPVWAAAGELGVRGCVERILLRRSIKTFSQVAEARSRRPS